MNTSFKKEMLNEVISYAVSHANKGTPGSLQKLNESARRMEQEIDVIENLLHVIIGEMEVIKGIVRDSVTDKNPNNIANIYITAQGIIELLQCRL